MYHYAQIDGDGYIVAISNLSGEVVADNMIPVPAGFNDLYQRWDFDSKTWIPIEKPEPEPTDSEILEKIAINSEYLAAMAEMEAEA
jgi:hypothetical protein